jgi:hypothetical protein
LTSSLKPRQRSRREAGERRQERGGRREEAGERRQERGGRREEAGERRQERGGRREEARVEGGDMVEAGEVKHVERLSWVEVRRRTGDLHVACHISHEGGDIKVLLPSSQNENSV